MGRKPTVWKNLPRGMRARPRGTKIFYYLDTGGKPRKEIPLGSDFVLAVAKWGQLTAAKIPASGVITVPYLAQRYRAEVMPTKSPRSKSDNEDELVRILKFFGDPPAPLDEVESTHIRQYKRWRVNEAKRLAEEKNAQRRASKKPELPIPVNYGHVRANRELALFSHMWNFAREEGLTTRSNPCAGISKFEETGRSVSPNDAVVELVLQHADQPLQFAIRLADIIGQRPSDVGSISETQIRDGHLHLTQGKTKAKLRIELDGRLASLIDEIRAYKEGIKQATGLFSLALLVNEKGQPLTMTMLRSRFDKARRLAGIDKEQFQFRDLRAKAAKDSDDAAGIKQAQALLGHTTEGMTAQYIRRTAGQKVRPIR